MSRGIHKFVVTLRPHEVRIRAQSVSLRGQAFTVGSVTVPVSGDGTPAVKQAVKKGLALLYPEPADATPY